MLQKRIPTILGLLLLLVGVVVGLFAVQTIQRLTAEASPGTAPDDVRISNVTDQGFTVSWVTEKDTTGFLSYGTTTRLGQTAFDDRAAGLVQFTAPIHYITVKGLQPKTKYFFKIGSGKTLFDEQGQPYTQETAAASVTPPPVAEPVYGTVKTSAGAGAGNAMVYLSTKGSVLSALTKADGNWLIPISNLRTPDGKDYLKLSESGEKLDLFVQGGASGTATASVDSSNTKPVPDISLGKHNQAFGGKEKVPEVPLEGTPSAAPRKPTVATDSARQPVATPAASVPIASPSAQVTVELTENQQFTTTQPTFRGKGKAGSLLTIRVESSPQTATVTVSSDGTWQWTPPQPLSNGQHTLTITTQGGIPVTRMFEVASAMETSLPNAGEPWVTLLLLLIGTGCILGGAIGLTAGRRGFLRW